MLIRTWMFFRQCLFRSQWLFSRQWLSFSRKSSAKPFAMRRRYRREAGFVQPALVSGLGVEALEPRQLLSATVLSTSAPAPPPSVLSGQGTSAVTSAVTPAVTPGVTPAVPNLPGSAVNSPPTASAPATASLNENSSLSFSTANGNALSITDAAAGTNADSLTLSVSQGTLTLASTTGLSFTAGGNGSSSFTVSGTVTNLDAALDGLVYQPTTLYAGADSLAASVSNPTDGLSAATSVSITVAPLSAPAISAPASGTVSQNGVLTFSSGNNNAISLTDAAAATNAAGSNATGSNADSLTLSASQGTLTLASANGLSFASGTNGSATFTVSGTVTDLNAALNGLVYQPTSGYSGSDSLSVSATDPGDALAASGSVALTVTPLSAAAMSAPGSEAATSAPASAAAIGATGSPSSSGNGSLASSGGNGSAVSITDSTAGADSDSLSQSTSQGTMSLGSGTGLSSTAGANGSAAFTAPSPVASANTPLTAVTYSGDGLSTSTDASLTASALATPAIIASGTAPGAGNTSLVFSSGNTSAMSVIDAAAGSNSDSLSFSVSRARLTVNSVTGLSFTTGTSGSSLSTATGAIANLSVALNGLTNKSKATHVGSDSLSLSDSDRSDSLSGGTTVVFMATALSTPAIVAPSSGTPDPNGSLILSASNGNAMSLKGAGNGSNSLTRSVADGTNAFVSAAGLSFTTGLNGLNSFTVTGAAANRNAALNGLSHKSSDTQVVSDSVSLADSEGTDSFAAATSVVFTVTALSAPAIVAPPSGTLDQNRSLIFSTSSGNAISLTGATAGGGSNSLTLSVAHGTITLASTTGLSFTVGTNGSDSFTVTGTAANLNAALNGIVYTPTRNFSGSDVLAVKVSDPYGYALTNVALRVNVIGPTLTAPTTGTVPLNGTLTFDKKAIQIADVNASTDIEQVVLRTNQGTLKLGSTTGITFVSGGSNFASMTISGTLTSLNAALNGLQFTPTTNFYGSGTINIKYADAMNGLSVSTKIAVTIGTTQASFGPPSETASPQSIGVPLVSPSTPSTAGGSTSSADLLDTVAADELARWDGFMAAMGLLNRS
jgi:hypothetical protein